MDVRVVSTNCPSGAGSIPRSSCLLLEVEPEGLAAKSVELRITEPDPAVPYLGSVVLCSGGNGAGFFASVTGGPELINELTRIGLRVFDRRWIDGWLSPTYRFTQVSQRLAVLLDWIHVNEHRGGAFFAVGNSGGSGELGYVLSTWNRESLFDAVVLGSGPTFTRLDFLCLPPSQAWSALCPAILPALKCGVPPCMAPTGPGTLCDVILGLPGVDLVAESILHPGADTSYPSMGLHFVFGTSDCSEWIAQGLLFESSVTSQHTLQVVPFTPHTICASVLGRQAILDALLGFVPPIPPRFELVFRKAPDRGTAPDQKR